MVSVKRSENTDISIERLMSAGPLPRTTPASQPIAKQEAGRLDLRAGSSPRLNCNPLGLHFVVEIFDICQWRSPFKLACQLRTLPLACIKFILSRLLRADYRPRLISL